MKVDNTLRPGDWRTISFTSEQPQTPFAPTWNHCIGEKLISKIKVNTDILRDFILEKEKEVLHEFPGSSDGNTGLGLRSMTSRFKDYNAMEWDHPEIKNLKKQISKFHRQFIKEAVGIAFKAPRVRIRCWCNVMRKGERIKKHSHAIHPHTYLGGHFTVACSETATIYVNPWDHTNENMLIQRVEQGENENNGISVYPAKNVVGKLTLFPNFIPHFTTKHPTDEERITMAFDLTPLPAVFREDSNELPFLDSDMGKL